MRPQRCSLVSRRRHPPNARPRRLRTGKPAHAPRSAAAADHGDRCADAAPACAPPRGRGRARPSNAANPHCSPPTAAAPSRTDAAAEAASRRDPRAGKAREQARARVKRAPAAAELGQPCAQRQQPPAATERESAHARAKCDRQPQLQLPLRRSQAKLPYARRRPRRLDPMAAHRLCLCQLRRRRATCRAQPPCAFSTAVTAARRPADRRSLQGG